MTPVAIHPTLNSEPLQLNCLVLGKSRNHIFIVEIAATKSVRALKDAIKEKKRPAFDYVPADTLVLWNASVPIKRNLKETIEALNLVDEDALQPPDILLDVFNGSG